MSERIEVGDLVVMVRACCDVMARRGLGIPWVVKYTWTASSQCKHCGSFIPNHTMATATREFSRGNDYAPVAWLKKIPPLREPAHHEEKETA